MAGFGRHHMLHEARFFELAGLTVEVEFIVTDAEATGSSNCFARSTSASSRPYSGTLWL